MASVLVTIGEVAEMLSARAPALAAELLPGGRKEGPEWVCGGLDGARGRSMAVHLQGAKAGVWSDFATGEAGDALDLVAQALFAGDKKEALTWAKSWLGLDGCDPARLRVTRRAVESRKNEDDSGDEGAEARRRRAQALWLGAQERLAGTLAEAYLVGRGIRLEHLGRQPRALRFHPAIWCQERAAKLPAMVAAIHNPVSGQFMATHRTYLARQRDGSIDKADLARPKKVLGLYRGGVIPLWRGASGKPLAKAPQGDRLIITEGIEDGLTVALAKPECRVICVVAIGHANAVRWPEAITDITVAAQNDKPGSPAARRLEQIMAGWLAEGRRVWLSRPPTWWRGKPVKDVNDLLQAAQVREDAVSE